MKRLLFRGAALAAINGVIAVLFLVAIDVMRQYEPWETDSVLEVMPHRTNFNAVILGTSHAYLLSRFRDNHAILERELGGRVFNMALPAAGGARPTRLLLEEFLARGNSAERLIYFIEPFVFFSPADNNQHKFVYYEPVRPGFLLRLIRDGYPWQRVFTYVRSKFSLEWIGRRPEVMVRHDYQLSPPIDPERVRKRLASLYMEGMSSDAFNTYAQELRRIAETAAAAGMRVYLLPPPTLIGHEPGMPQLEKFIEELADRHTFVYRDLTYAIPEPRYYYDLDHLNTMGVEHLARDLLLPILGVESPTAAAGNSKP